MSDYPTADAIARAILDALKAEGYRIFPPKRAPARRAPGDEANVHVRAGLSPDWTPEEIEIVRALYPDTSIPAFVIADKIERSVEAVKKMARKIGVARRFAKPQVASAKKEEENPPLRKTPEIETPLSEKAPEIMPEIMREAPSNEEAKSYVPQIPASNDGEKRDIEAIAPQRLNDRDPLPEPRRATRGIVVTGAILGDPGFENPREHRGESSKNGSAFS